MVEEVLSRHLSVQVAAVVGEPDALKGELPIAYVQLRSGTNADAAELLSLCLREVPERAAVPIDVVIIEAIPLTAVGKIFKPALRLDAMGRAARKVIASVLGDCSGVEVEVLETEARAAVILRLPVGPSAEAHAATLRQAFAGFLFDIRIIMEVE